VSVLDRIRTRLRRDAPPPEVVQALDRDDRLLAWATTADGVVVASRAGLRLPDSRVLPWHRIDKAVWRDAALTLTESGEVAPGIAEALPPLVVPLAEPRDLPSVVRSRVTRSVAFTSYDRLPGGRGVRVVARRVAGQDGLDWSLRFDDPNDRHDPGALAAAEQLLAAARTDMTLPE
jgi:hypothetical protein